jgi:hypothetical protein
MKTQSVDLEKNDKTYKVSTCFGDKVWKARVYEKTSKGLILFWSHHIKESDTIESILDKALEEFK